MHGALPMNDNRPGDLIKEYPPEIMQHWGGCFDLDCLPGCRLGLNEGYCVRLANFLQSMGYHDQAD